MLYGGRWNSPGKRVIYAAETYAAALLEVLVHRNGAEPPKHHRLVRILIPDGVSVETVHAQDVPGWNRADCRTARRFGDEWFASARSLLLRVPSVVTDGREFNLIIHAEHPEFRRLKPQRPENIRWDGRLFGRDK